MSGLKVTPETESLITDTEAEDVQHVKKDLQGRIAMGTDTYGAVHYALLRAIHEEVLEDPDEDEAPDLGVWHVLFHALMWNVVALVLQILAMFILVAFVNSASQDPFQKLNYKFFPHSEVESEGNLKNATTVLNNAIDFNISLNETLPFNANILNQCDKDSNVPYTLGIFLMVLSVQFVSTIIGAAWDIWNYVMYVETDDEMSKNFTVTDPKDKLGKRQVVTYVSTNAKILIVLLNFLPKLAINIYTYFIGAGFLCLANGVTQVVLKSMGVALISKFPTVFFSSFIAEDIAKLVKVTSIAYVQNKDASHQELKKLWGFPIFKAVIALLTVIYFVQFRYGNIHRFRTACYYYGDHFVKPYCGTETHWPCGEKLLFWHVYNGVKSYKAAGLHI